MPAVLQSVPVVSGAVRRARSKADADVRQLTAAEKRNVIDLCYLCKMCELRCPYTPGDGHEFQLDFPRLMQRAKAVTAKESGVQFRDKMLGNPDRLGQARQSGSGAGELRMPQHRCNRALMEKLLGIHRDKKLPEFAEQTLDKWLREPICPSRPPTRPPRSCCFRPASSITTTPRRAKPR